MGREDTNMVCKGREDTNMIRDVMPCGSFKGFILQQQGGGGGGKAVKC